MLRSFLCAVAALVVGVGFAAAAEQKGKVKSSDPAASKVVLTVDGKDVELTCGSDCQVVRGKKDKPIKKGLKALKEGTEVTATCEEKDGKQVCTKIVVAKKPKNNNK